MAERPDLDALYEQAQAALAAKDFERASNFLRRILISDENHKDASRLLADLVARQRHRWHNDPRLWGAFGEGEGSMLSGACPGIFTPPRR